MLAKKRRKRRGKRLKRRHRKPFQIEHMHVHQCASKWRTSHAAATTAQQIACWSDRIFFMMEAVRGGEFDENLPPLPDPAIWRKLYYSHRQLTDAVSRAFFGDVGGEYANEMLGFARDAARVDGESRELACEAMFGDGSIEGLNQAARSSLRSQGIQYRRHLRILRAEIRGHDPDRTTREDHLDQLAESAELYFYIRIVLFAALEYRTTPRQLLKAARSPIDDKRREKAVERLVRLDPNAREFPEVRKWFNVADGIERQGRLKKLAKWQSEGMGTGRFNARGVKVMLGGAVWAAFRRFGKFIDWLNWDESPIGQCNVRCRDILELFHAAERDRQWKLKPSKRELIEDPDLRGMDEENWERQTREFRKCFEQVPGLGTGKN